MLGIHTNKHIKCKTKCSKQCSELEMRFLKNGLFNDSKMLLWTLETSEMWYSCSTTGMRWSFIQSTSRVCEVRHWCWAIRPGCRLAFQIIPNAFEGIEIRDLSRLVMFFHNNLKNQFYMDLSLCTRTLSCWNRKAKVTRYLAKGRSHNEPILVLRGFSKPGEHL